MAAIVDVGPTSVVQVGTAHVHMVASTDPARIEFVTNRVKTILSDSGISPLRSLSSPFGTRQTRHGQTLAAGNSSALSSKLNPAQLHDLCILRRRPRNLDAEASEATASGCGGGGNEVVYACSVCRLTSPTQGAIRAHVVRVHLALPAHACVYCSATFMAKRDVLTHHEACHPREALVTGLQPADYRDAMSKLLPQVPYFAASS
ncbi:unnamed protein product [Protopolystoma xenopodis]|uniref:C2H2-type domain-containing protein n=1 Tax=Protopolystoma xenopodis TaxID=117903 RepID=A0A448WIB8_9PLAT|nr:unnamed protein product [Protopolystoma xenopodis]